MSRNEISLEFGALRRVSMLNFTESCKNINNIKRQKILSMILTAINKELTPRQRQCVNLYYIEGKSVPIISKELGISPPTIYKHISKGINYIKKYANYFMEGMEDTQ